MTSLGRAVLSLVVDRAGLEKGLDAAERTSAQKVQAIGKRLSLSLTPAILSIGTAVLKATDTIQEAMATIRTGTGATGEALEGLQADFTAVFRQTSQDAQTTGAAIADLNTTLGLTGEPLREAALAALQLADATGADTAALINNTARAMQVFGEDSADVVPIMDRLFVVSQNTGLGIDALTGQLQTYGPVLRNAGFETKEAAAFLGNLHAAGVDASRVFPGLNAYFRKTAAEGVTDLKGALLDVVGAVEAATSDAEALNVATTAFGAEGAQRMSVAIRNGTFDMEQLIAAMETADGAIASNDEATQTLSERLQIWRNRITSVLGAFGQLPPALQDATLAMGGLLAAAGPVLFVLPQMVRSIQLLRTGLHAATVSTTAFGVATRVALGPVGLVVTAIGVLGGVLATLALRSRASRGEVSELDVLLGQLRESGTELQPALNPVPEAIRNIGSEAADAKVPVDELTASLNQMTSAQLNVLLLKTNERIAEIRRTLEGSFSLGGARGPAYPAELADLEAAADVFTTRIANLEDQETVTRAINDIATATRQLTDENKRRQLTEAEVIRQQGLLAEGQDTLREILGDSAQAVIDYTIANNTAADAARNTAGAIRDQAAALLELNDIGEVLGFGQLTDAERRLLAAQKRKLDEANAEALRIQAEADAETQRLADLRGQAVDEQQQYNDRLADIREAHGERIEDLDVAFARDEAALNVRQGKEQIDLANKQADQLTAIRRDYHADRREIERRTNAAITDARRDHQRRIEELVETHQERLADLERGAEDKREEAETRRGRRIEDIEREHAEAVTDLRYDPQRAVKVAALILNRDRNLEELEIGHARTLEDIQRNLGDDQEQAEIDFARRREDSAEAHHAKIVDIQQRGQQQQAERRIQFNMAQTAAERQHVIELRELAQKHIDDRLALEQQDGERREDATTGFNRNLEDAQDDLESNLLASADEWGDDFAAEFQSTYDRIVGDAQRAAAAARAAFSGGGGQSSGGSGRSAPSTASTPGATPRYDPFNDDTGEPLLASGGIVRARPGGTRVTVGEGREDELVSPLSEFPHLLARTLNMRPMLPDIRPMTPPTYIDPGMISRGIGAAGGGGGGRGDVHLTVNIEGSVLAEDLTEIIEDRLDTAFRRGWGSRG